MDQKRFERDITACQCEIHRWEQRYNRISAIRLLLFIVSLGACILLWRIEPLLSVLCAGVGLLLFICLMKWHGDSMEQLAQQKSRKAVLQWHQSRMGEEWRQEQTDSGAEFLSSDFPQAVDLDLFGPKSLYHYISTANTPWGREKLEEALRVGMTSPTEIAKRQAAVSELVQKHELAMELEALSRRVAETKKNPDMEGFLQYARRQPKGQWPVALRIFTWGLPPITIALFLLGLCHILPLAAGSLCFVVQLGFLFVGYRKTNRILTPLFSLQDSLTPYETILRRLEQESFDSESLRELQGRLHGGGASATAGIQKLAGIAQGVYLRYNQVVYTLACGLLMWNYHMVEALERWRRCYGARLEGWLEAVGDAEMLLSLGTLCRIKDQTCFPTITQDQEPGFEAVDLAHPLITQDKVVANSFSLRAQTCILTGSNMSGKTTFLRCIGVNLTLAYAGGPVCATALSASRMKIFTSMRIQDDVSQGISTFYAEILRIKTMVEYSRERLPMLALVDEIFKGTNSADRVIGATEAAKKLSRPWICCLISTHDFELCDLENDPEIRAVNHHFTEYYEGDTIRFDYRIQEGRCRTTNAKQLLRMAGILETEDS